MMLCVADGVPYSALSESQRAVQAVFKDSSMPTIAARADAYVKIGGADNPLVGTPVWYKRTAHMRWSSPIKKPARFQGGRACGCAPS